MHERIFRIDTPSQEDVAHWDTDGFIVFPGVLTDEAREGLPDEMLHCTTIADFLETQPRNGGPRSQRRFASKPWNEKGPSPLCWLSSNGRDIGAGRGHPISIGASEAGQETAVG